MKEIGNKNYEGLSKEERESLFFSKVETIFKELVGFSQWEASYILDGVTDKLEKQKEGVLDQLTVIL